MSLKLRQSQELQAIQVFYSYADKDTLLHKELEKHLSMLKRQGLISSWHYRTIVAGEDRKQEIDTYLNTSHLILLLISPDFLASDYCYGREIMRAIERHELGECRVIPIILRPVSWEGTSFDKFQALPFNSTPVVSKRWHNRDEAWANIVVGLRNIIKEMNPTRSISTSITPPIWHIPYARNPFFTGREDILQQLHQMLHAENIVAVSQPQGNSALGGIGKTQTAIEYAYRYGTNYNVVFWVQADSAAALMSGYMNLARLLHLPKQNEQDQRIIVETVLHWLHMHTGWLLIFDSVDDLSIAEPFLPKAERGHIVFTTRSHVLREIAPRLEVQPMEPETGALLLLHRSTILSLSLSLDGASHDDRRVACEISQELGGFPLALDQAGAYIKETFCTLIDYLALYRICRQDLLQVRGNLDRNSPLSVTTTCSLSFEKVRQAHPAAADLLTFCAFLAPDAIPEEFLIAGSSHLGPILAPVVTNPIQLDQIYKEVLRYSLFQRGSDMHTLIIHRLVQAVLQDNLPPETQVDWKQRAVLVVNAANPNVQDITQWDACEKWLPHVLVCATWIEQEQFRRQESADVLNQATYYLNSRARYRETEPLLKLSLAIWEQHKGITYPDIAGSLNNLAALYDGQGKYAEAEPLYQRALAISEQQLGAIHPSTVSSLNNLADLYQTQGKYTEAEPLYVRALSISEQQLGVMHPDTASSLNNLADLYQTQGKYVEAEPLYVRALAIYEQHLGVMHPVTASSLNNLATLYQTQGKYTEAEPLYVRALAITEQHLGATHPSTASSLNNLAELYKAQGKYREAEPLYMRALAIYEQQLGAMHSNTASSLNNLAGLYNNQGKYAEAEPLYQRALSISEQQLGPMHPAIARRLNNLAALYDSQGKYAEAEPLYVRALSISEQQLGVMHPSTASSLNNLAGLYDTQGKYAEAEPLYQRALAIYEQQLGATHPSTASSLNNLAGLYDTQGKYAEAEPLYQRALAIYEQQLGAMHPSTASSLNNLAVLYDTQGKYAEAEPLYQRALVIREQHLGATHPDTASSLNNLAGLYNNQGKYAEAEPLYQRALSIYEQHLGATHPDTASSLNNLAALYRVQGKYAEAEPLYQRALVIREQHLGATHPDTASSLNNLAALYNNQGKYAEAEPLYQRALSIYEQHLGATHPSIASSLNNLAVLYGAQGKYAEAESLYQRSLQVSIASLGIEHPQTRRIISNCLMLLSEIHSGGDLEVLLHLLVSQEENTDVDRDTIQKE